MKLFWIFGFYCPYKLINRWGMKISRKLKNTAVAVLLVCAGIAAYFYYNQDTQSFSFKTSHAKVRDIVVSIDATGTVEPEDLIQIAARVSGEILSFGTDKNGKTVDYGSEVTEGSILAIIDDEIPRSNLLQAKSQLEQRKASLEQAKANLTLGQTKLEQANRDWARAEKLGVGDALAQSTYDNYKSAFEIATAEIGVLKAAISQANAQIDEAQASLKVQERNLEYCIIKAPVDGVVIDRVVNIGQTVVSSMSASSLFLVAKDLKKMEVWASVNEADIGSIAVGQPVTFTVDAFPEETFVGKVGKVRLNATMSQNVVTYIVEVATDNSNGRLLPYLTANLKFEVARKDKAFCVPNSSLRFTPEASQISPSASEDALNAEVKVWTVADDGLALPIAVEAGLSDGEMTAIIIPGGAENKKLSVITTVMRGAAAENKSTNPFIPTPPARKKPGSGAPKN